MFKSTILSLLGPRSVQISVRALGVLAKESFCGHDGGKYNHYKSAESLCVSSVIDEDRYHYSRERSKCQNAIEYKHCSHSIGWKLQRGSFWEDECCNRNPDYP